MRRIGSSPPAERGSATGQSCPDLIPSRPTTGTSSRSGSSPGSASATALWKRVGAAGDHAAATRPMSPGSPARRNRHAGDLYV